MNGKICPFCFIAWSNLYIAAVINPKTASGTDEIMTRCSDDCALRVGDKCGLRRDAYENRAKDADLDEAGME